MDKLVLTAIAQIVSATIAAGVTIIVLRKTSDVQRKLKELDGTIKRSEIEFSFYSKSIDFAHSLLRLIVEATYEKQSAAVLPAKQLEILLKSLDCLKPSDNEVFCQKNFALSDDFDRWKCDIHELTLTRIYDLKRSILK